MRNADGLTEQVSAYAVKRQRPHLNEPDDSWMVEHDERLERADREREKSS